MMWFVVLTLILVTPPGVAPADFDNRVPLIVEPPNDLVLKTKEECERWARAQQHTWQEIAGVLPYVTDHTVHCEFNGREA